MHMSMYPGHHVYVSLPLCLCIFAIVSMYMGTVSMYMVYMYGGGQNLAMYIFCTIP